MLPHPFDKLPSTALNTARYQRNEKLFLQGDEPFALCYLEMGQIQLVRHNENGEEVIIHRARAGETFAEASLFSNQYHCDAIALDEAVVIKLNKMAILKEMKHNASFAMALTARFASQIQSLRRLHEIQAITSAKQRVLTAISQGLLTTQIKTFATQINLTHETTYRALAQLVKEGRLEKVGRGAYSVID